VTQDGCVVYHIRHTLTYNTNLSAGAFLTCFSGEVDLVGFSFTEDPAAESCFLGFVFPLSANTSEA